MTGRLWAALPPSIQFPVLLVAMPGMVVHEYVHAIVALLEGAQIDGFDWTDGGVVIADVDETSWRTHVAPTAAGVVWVAVGAVVAVTQQVSLPIALWAYLGLQTGLLIYPSPADIANARERAADTSDRSEEQIFVSSSINAIVALVGGILIPWELFFGLALGNAISQGLVVTAAVLGYLSFSRLMLNLPTEATK